MCQKDVSSSWKDDLKLRLEPVDQLNYDIIFSYNPRLEGGNQKGSSKELFWQSELDVVCHLADHIQHIRLPVTRHQRQAKSSISVPTSLGSGPLTCEAWMNRPVHRFRSNTVQHKSASGKNNQHHAHVPQTVAQSKVGGRPAANGRPRLRDLAAGLQQQLSVRYSDSSPPRTRPLAGFTIRRN